MPPPGPELPDDAGAFPLLDAYLEELHAGRPPDRERILRERPELAGLLDWLDSLEQLARRPGTEAPPAAPATDLTTLPPAVAAAPGPGPASFGKYELLRELGRGGMGVVYLARQRDLDRVVALKMILGPQLASPEQVERFHEEARAAARLSHPHIVQVYDAGVQHGQHYFAMQYVPGRSLGDLLQARSLTVEQAVTLLADVARAVAYLHGEGVVHRDLKPSNVLVDAGGRPYLTDFGLAKFLGSDSRLTSPGAVLGTPSYMPPEQAAGSQEVGPRSDVYSLGAILYEMLTGRPPFREARQLDTLVQVLEGEPALPRRLNPRLPRELERICLCCLEKAPERRYPSAAALADDLERYLRGEAVEARPQGAWPRLQRWARREPALVSRLAGLAVLTAILQANYHLDAARDTPLHLQVLAVVAAWAAAAWVCQRLQAQRRWADAGRLAWVALEPFLVTALLLLTGNALSPLLIAYPLLVAGSGLWFQVRLVWAATATAVVGFAVLAACSRSLQMLPYQAVVFGVGLVILGAIVAHQVQRVRALSRYYENRPLP
jgi:serine/threonine-protein kinase